MAERRLWLLLMLTRTLMVSVCGLAQLNGTQLLNSYEPDHLVDSDGEDGPEVEGVATSDKLHPFSHHGFQVEDDKFSPEACVNDADDEFQVEFLDALPRSKSHSPGQSTTALDLVCSEAGFQITLLRGHLRDVKVLGTHDVLPIMEVPKSCGYDVNHLKNTLFIPFTGCHVKHTDGYTVKLLYSFPGQTRIATASCVESLDSGLLPHLSSELKSRCRKPSGTPPKVPMESSSLSQLSTTPPVQSSAIPVLPTQSSSLSQLSTTPPPVLSSAIPVLPTQSSSLSQLSTTPPPVLSSAIPVLPPPPSRPLPVLPPHLPLLQPSTRRPRPPRPPHPSSRPVSSHLPSLQPSTRRPRPPRPTHPSSRPSIAQPLYPSWPLPVPQPSLSPLQPWPPYSSWPLPVEPPNSSWLQLPLSPSKLPLQPPYPYPPWLLPVQPPTPQPPLSPSKLPAQPKPLQPPYPYPPWLLPVQPPLPSLQSSTPQPPDPSELSPQPKPLQPQYPYPPWLLPVQPADPSLSWPQPPLSSELPLQYPYPPWLLPVQPLQPSTPQPPDPAKLPPQPKPLQPLYPYPPWLLPVQPPLPSTPQPPDPSSQPPLSPSTLPTQSLYPLPWWPLPVQLSRPWPPYPSPLWPPALSPSLPPPLNPSTLVPPLASPSPTPPPLVSNTQRCAVSKKERVRCGKPGISSSYCKKMRCCVDSQTSACYYPLDDCTVDQHFVFAIRYNSTSVRVDPTKLVIPGSPKCKPVIVNDKVAIFKFGVTECGTHSYVVGETKIYLAEVQTVVQALNLKYGVITRSDPLRFLIECRYTITGTPVADPAQQFLVSVGYMVKTPSSSWPSAIISTGLYGVQLRIATDHTYKNYFSTCHLPLRRLLGKPVYLELRLKSPKPDAVILVNYCVAYPQSAKNALVLIYEGCTNPYDPNVSILKVHGLPQNRHQRRFVVDAFQFMDQKTNKYLNEEIHFMCSVEVCRPAEKLCEEQCFDGKTPEALV